MNLRKVAEIIQQKLNVSTEICKVQRGGVVLFGINVGDGYIRPVFYPSDYCKNTDEEIANEIIEDYKKSIKLTEDIEEYCSEMMDKLYDWNFVKNHIFPCLRPVAQQKDDINAITFPFLDLEMYFRANFDDFSSSITKRLANVWGVTHDEIKNRAIENLSDLNKILFSSLDIFMFAEQGVIDKEKALWNIKRIFSPLFILCFKSCQYGAGALCSEKVLQKIAEVIEDDFYILPSSIHDCVILKFSEIEDFDFNEMIHDGNATLLDVDILSDHAYLYKRDTQTIECV